MGSRQRPQQEGLALHLTKLLPRTLLAQASPPPPVLGEGRGLVQLGSREGSNRPLKSGRISRQLLRLTVLISSAFPVTGTKSRVDEGALQACEGGGPELEVGEVGILLRQSQRHQGQLTLPANVCVSL